MYHPLRLCSQGGGFEAVPDPPGALDLFRVRATLEAAGLSVLDARVMLVVTVPPEATISRSGRLLFKTGDERSARAAFERLVGLLDLRDGPTRSSHRATR